MRRLQTLSLKSFSGINKLASVFLFLLYFGQAYGQTHSFSGSIGKYPIYLQINIAGSDVSGYYFYKNKLIDIFFVGTYKAGIITASATDESGEITENPETFKFKWPNKAPVGTWTNKGKMLDLKLLPLTQKETGSPKCTNQYFLKENPEINNPNNQLKKVKVGHFKLKEVNTVQTINGIKIRHFEEVNTKISLFRIDSGLVAEKQKDANLYLEYLQISEYLASLECASYSTYGSDYSYSVSDITISNDLISFSVFAAFYCGGAHPEESNYGITYDLNTHRRIESSDFLIPGKETIYEERVYAYLAKNNPEYFNENNDSDVMECQYFQRELWTADCDFVFTSKGLKLLPSFAHYMAPCLDPEWAVIPYSELKDVIKPEYYSKLNRLKP